MAPEAAPDRVAFVADLAAAWAQLRHIENGKKRVALILANYPNRDGRLGNGVGLDTPAGSLEVLKAMRGAGYETGGLPEGGDALIAHLMDGPTNAATDGLFTPRAKPVDNANAAITNAHDKFPLNGPLRVAVAQCDQLTDAVVAYIRYLRV